jgi:hypothetical protein
MTRICIPLLALTILPSSSTNAAPLDPARLPDNAKWVIHFDAAALHTSGILKDVQDRFPPIQAVRSELRKIKKQIGIDPTRDILGVTVYDNQFVKDSGVVLIDVKDLDSNRLIDQLKQHRPNHKTSEYGGHTIYSWMMEPGRKSEHIMSGATYKNTVILSRSKDLVTGAIDRLAGQGQTVAADSPLAQKVSKGTIVLGRAVGMDQAKTPFNSHVVREARSLSVAAGRAGDEFFVEGTMVAASTDIAKQCRAVVEGFRGIAALNAPDDTARRIVNALTVSADGDTVTAAWRVSRDDIISAVEKQLKNRRPDTNKPDRPANELPGQSSDAP